MKDLLVITGYILLAIATVIGFALIGAVIWGIIFAVFAWFLPDLTLDLFKAMHIDKYTPFEIGMVVGFTVVLLRSMFGANTSSK